LVGGAVETLLGVEVEVLWMVARNALSACPKTASRTFAFQSARVEYLVTVGTALACLGLSIVILAH